MDLRATLLEQTDRFADLIAAGDPDTPVPTCPGWTLRDLGEHVGGGHRWAAQIIAERRSRALERRDVRDGRPPEDPDAADAWLRQSAQSILDAVDRVGSDARVWTFTGPRAAGFWIRRRLHEAVVHRFDAALAVGTQVELPPELAADTISEWIDLVSQNRRAPVALDQGQSLHLHATDDRLGPTGEWTIVHDDQGVEWFHDHRKSAVALRGPATGLLLAITRRTPAAESGVEILGDAGVWDAWLERTPFG